jgi:hypothetical protein
MPFRSPAQDRALDDLLAKEAEKAKTQAKHTPPIKVLPDHTKFNPEKRADGPGWDPSLAIFKPLPSQQAPQGQASPLAGQGGGFRGVVQSGQPARADGAPEASQGGGNPLDRYGPARRRRLLTDPLVVGGAFFGKGAALEKGAGRFGKLFKGLFTRMAESRELPDRAMQPHKKKEENMVGKEASLRLDGRQVGKTATRMTLKEAHARAVDTTVKTAHALAAYRAKTSHVPASGMGKTAHALAAAGDRELQAGSQGAALRGAMGAFERAWVKAGWADMSPAPATSYAPQGAALLPTGTAPHAATLAAMQGTPPTPSVPATRTRGALGGLQRLDER